ncbi:unnamed protein product [Penicillium pancosmium]
MILSGLEVVSRQLVRNLRHIGQQQQPCGIDLTLRQVSKWTSAASIDFDNTKRKAAKTSTVALTWLTSTKLSSLWRSGVSISAGVVDAGYEGAMGALMEVKNPHGLVLYQNAKLAQLVIEELNTTVDGYSGIYQSSTNSNGIDGKKQPEVV